MIDKEPPTTPDRPTARCTCFDRGLTAHDGDCVIFTIPESERTAFQFNQYMADRARPEQLAKRFHEAYERLAPSFGYETRKASAVPWEQVPENNRRLMTAVAAEVLESPRASSPSLPTDDDTLLKIVRETELMIFQLGVFGESLRTEASRLSEERDRLPEILRAQWKNADTELIADLARELSLMRESQLTPEEAKYALAQYGCATEQIPMKDFNHDIWKSALVRLRRISEGTEK